MSIQDHFLIHLEQGDFAAAFRILTKIKIIKSNLIQLGITPKMLSQFMIENKLGVWSNDSKNKSLETKRKNKIGFCHNSELQSKGGNIGGKIGIKIAHQKMKENGTGIYSKEHQVYASKFGASKGGKTHKGKLKPIIICPYCNKSGGGHALMNRWHFDNCKFKNM